MIQLSITIVYHPIIILHHTSYKLTIIMQVDDPSQPLDVVKSKQELHAIISNHCEAHCDERLAELHLSSVDATFRST